MRTVMDRTNDPKTIALIELLKEGMTQAEAGLRAGFGKNLKSSQTTVSRLLKNPSVVKMVEKANIGADILEKAKIRMYVSRDAKLVKKLVTHMVDGDTQAVAAAKAGYTGHNINTLRAAASRALNNPRLAKSIIEVLDAHDLNDELAAKILGEGLKAERPIVVSGGKEAATVEMHPDNLVRGIYLDKLLKLRGHMKNQDAENGNVVIRISNPVKDGMNIGVGIQPAQLPSANVTDAE
jgi:phage terminase small subunit